MSHFQSDRFKDLEENSTDEIQFAKASDGLGDEISELENAKDEFGGLNSTKDESGQYEENPIFKWKQKLLSQGISIQDLTESNPTLCGFHFPKEIIHSSLAHEWNPVYEPIARGSQIAREAVVRYYQDRFPSKKDLFHIDDFFLVSSTSEAYSYILKSITNPGDNILIPNPGYPLLEHLACWEMVDTISYSNFEEIPSLVTNRTKAILLVQPNNPTGKILNPEEILLLEHLANKYNLAILVDEVFADYVGWCNSSKYTFFQSNEVPIFTLNGLSKICLLPSAKLSWIHIQAPTHLKQKLDLRLEWLADTYLSVNGFAETILPNVLEARSLIQNQLINRMKRNFGKLQEILEEKYFHWERPDGGWYFILETEVSQDLEDEFCLDLLKNHHKSVQSGILYGFESEFLILILSMILPESQFEEGLHSLNALMIQFKNSKI